MLYGGLVSELNTMSLLAYLSCACHHKTKHKH